MGGVSLLAPPGDAGHPAAAGAHSAQPSPPGSTTGLSPTASLATGTVGTLLSSGTNAEFPGAPDAGPSFSSRLAASLQAASLQGPRRMSEAGQPWPAPCQLETWASAPGNLFCEDVECDQDAGAQVSRSWRAGRGRLCMPGSGVAKLGCAGEGGGGGMPSQRSHANAHALRMHRKGGFCDTLSPFWGRGAGDTDWLHSAHTLPPWRAAGHAGV